MKDELLDKRLKLEEEYHDLLDRDYPRFDIKDLLEFARYLSSDERIDDLELLFTKHDMWGVMISSYSFYDVMNYLHRKREGKLTDEIQWKA